MAGASAFTPPPKSLPRTIGHYQEWIAAAKGGKPANCRFEFGALLTEVALLGVIAIRTGRPLEWDSAGMRITNEEFDAFMTASWSSLYRTAVLMTGDTHLAEDLLQTTMGKVYKSWHRVSRV